MKYNLPDGTYFLEEADQWSQTSYTVKGNLIYMNYVDRHDPQVIDGTGMTVDEFLASPSVKQWSKDWIREMVIKYSV